MPVLPFISMVSNIPHEGSFPSAKVNVFNLLTTIISHHIETNQLIFSANQLTNFYMMVNIGR